MQTQEITPELQAAIDAYEARRAARVERFRNRASRADAASTAHYERSRSMLDVIPLGQPILVGHHSERRHRNLLRRADRAMQRSCEASRKADYWERRADSAECNGAIASDDPAATIKLRERIAELELKQQQMKDVNRALRSKNRNAALKLLGFTDEQIVKILTPDCMGAIGFPSYAMQNNNANIRRLRDRLTLLERVAAAPKPQEIAGKGCTIIVNPLNGRWEIRFASKPAADMIARLKAQYWALRRKDGEWFWTSHRTDQANALVKELTD